MMLELVIMTVNGFIVGTTVVDKDDRDQNNIIKSGRVSFTINTILEGKTKTSENISINIYQFGDIYSIQI